MSYSLMYIFQIITNQPLHLWSACGMRAQRLAKEEELEGAAQPHNLSMSSTEESPAVGAAFKLTVRAMPDPDASFNTDRSNRCRATSTSGYFARPVQQSAHQLRAQSGGSQVKCYLHSSQNKFLPPS